MQRLIPFFLLLVWIDVAVGIQACEFTFSKQPNLFAKIENSQLQFLFADNNFETHFASLSWNRRRRVRKLIQNLNHKPIASFTALKERVSELTVLLYGNPNVVDSYLLKSKNQREIAFQEFELRRSALFHAVIESWTTYFERYPRNWHQRLAADLSHFFEHRYFNYVKFPLFLPKVEWQPLSKDTVESAIEQASRDSQWIEIGGTNRNLKYKNYEVFRRLYSPIVLGFFLMANTYVGYHEIKAEVTRGVDKSIQELQGLALRLPVVVEIEKDRTFDETLAKIEADFKEKWKDDPTAQERAQMVRALRKSLGYDRSSRVARNPTDMD